MNDDRRVLALALGTFHAVFLTLLLVILLYLTVDLGEALAELNTAVGLAIFGALWATSVYCTYRGLLDSGLRPGFDAPAVNVLANGAKWGAWNGTLFFWCLLAAGFLTLLVLALGEGAEQVAGVCVFGVVAFGVGTIASYAIGSFLGLVFTLLDLQLLGLAGLLANAGTPVQKEGRPL